MSNRKCRFFAFEMTTFSEYFYYTSILLSFSPIYISVKLIFIQPNVMTCYMWLLNAYLFIFQYP